ncbi:MAG: hypothetical protein GXY48_11705 [Methanomicrobiales archaeon]|nr:hypothetical protein [Methanomicrobiales archaeon]
MTIRKDSDKIFLDGRNLSELDRFVCNVLDIISKYTSYVIVSGYVAILFGRSRSTEDVDILIPFCDISLFIKLHDELLENNYEFLNAEDSFGLFSILTSGSGVRLCEKDSFIPNIEIKFVKNESDDYSFQNRIPLIIADKNFYISPLEIQIAYKIWLGSEKDIEDALFLKEVTSDFIDEKLLQEFYSSFKVKL